MRVPVDVFDVDIERSTGSPSHEGLRLGTRRTTRPGRTWFEPWLAIARETQEKDLVRRLAAQRGVRSVLVIPVDHDRYFPLHGVSPRGNDNHPQRLFDRAKRPF